MQNEIQERLISAMKAGDKKHILILRDIKANLSEAEKLMKKKLSEQECFDVLSRMAKKRRQSIKACGDNYKYQDLKQQEEFELMVIEEYLPIKMNINEIKDVINQIIILENINQGMEHIGKVMKSFNERYPNQDGKLVSKIVRELLST